MNICYIETNNLLYINFLLFCVMTSKRPKPVAAKASVSRNPKRRYCGGGKLKK